MKVILASAWFAPNGHLFTKTFVATEGYTAIPLSLKASLPDSAKILDDSPDELVDEMFDNPGPVRKDAFSRAVEREDGGQEHNIATLIAHAEVESFNAVMEQAQVAAPVSNPERVSKREALKALLNKDKK